ncbi:MAG: hypothetical protein V4613_11165 [Bacteroidota bacterium]
MSTYCKQLFFFIVLLMAISCKEKDPQPEDLGFISLGEAKDYLLFKPGTWWVYKNSVTNELDTTLLESCGVDTAYAKSKKRVFTYERVGYYKRSLRDNAIYRTFSGSMNPDVVNFNPGWVLECIRENGYREKYFSGSGVSCHFYYPFDRGGAGNGVYETTFNNKQDSIVVSGKTYYDIVSFSIYHDGTFPYPNIYVGPLCNNIYYWAKGYGIIKIEMQGWDINNNIITMNWELIDYKIIK